MKYTSFLLPILGAIILSGCSDWHLRGVVDGEEVSFSAYVSFSRANRVGRAMNNALSSRGAVLAGSKSIADFSIEILNERFERRVLSIDPVSSKVRELELRLNCEIMVRDKEGLLIVPRQTLRLTRDYFFDELSAEFTTNQREILENDLAADAATSIILRLDPKKKKVSK